MNYTHAPLFVRFGKSWAANCRCGREGQTLYPTKVAGLAGYRGIGCR